MYSVSPTVFSVTELNNYVKRILDNPIYYGKIAFGRRGREKIKGTKNQYKVVYKDFGQPKKIENTDSNYP